MKNGKTPGNDGLTKEFYVCFFGELGMLLLKSVNYSHFVGELSTSQKQAVVTLIENKGRDKKACQKLETDFPHECRCSDCFESFVIPS